MKRLLIAGLIALGTLLAVPAMAQPVVHHPVHHRRPPPRHYHHRPVRRAVHHPIHH